MAAENSVIPLFPLHTVLFPGGPLPLRIFETRYTDMVRRCMRAGEPFGVVLIQQGDEAGEVATTATVGSTARIADFHTLPDGLLGISCVGERKFRVQRVWRAADGLNMGEVQWLAAEPELPLPPDYERLASAVRRALDDLAEHYEHVEKKFADAAWVSARLAELLPIELNDKQALLEMEDPIARLDALMTLAPEA
ncbi:MAG: LON peptidase substrate-binding domain-containing protein [Pseudomonadota bacterium]